MVFWVSAKRESGNIKLKYKWVTSRHLCTKCRPIVGSSGSAGPGRLFCLLERASPGSPQTFLFFWNVFNSGTQTFRFPGTGLTYPHLDETPGGSCFGVRNLWRSVGAPRGKSTIFQTFTMEWRNWNKTRLSLPRLLLQQCLPKFRLFCNAVDSSHGRGFCSFVTCDDCLIYILTTHPAACCWMKNCGSQLSDATRCPTSDES